MARTLRNLILGILKDCNYDSGSAELSGAELYEDARSRGYDGLHHVLIRRADELAKQGIIKAKPTGRMQSNCYQYAQSQPGSKSLFQEAMERVDTSPENARRLARHPLLQSKGLKVYGPNGVATIPVKAYAQRTPKGTGPLRSDELADAALDCLAELRGKDHIS